MRPLRHALKRYGLPVVTRLFAVPGLSHIPPLLEATGAALQSKRGGGYMATWQEIEGALNFVTRPAPLIFDVGANVGNWASAILKAEPQVSKLFLFEPQESCWPSLMRICDEKIVVERKVVSDACGTLTFWENRNSELSSIHEGGLDRSDSHPIRVEAITIDEFIRQNAIDTVDYMKIDVEGHEMSVIRGARSSIERGIIKAFSFEFGLADVASRTFFKDFWQYLTELHLRVYRLGHDGKAIHISRYSADLEVFSGVTNYVASFHEPRHRR